MKKIYYLLAFAAITITGCQKQPIIAPGGSAANEVKAINITLGSSDYSTLGTTVYASKTQNFNSDADAKLYIPTILNNQYPQLSNGSTANVTFSEPAPAQPVLVDSVYKDQQYTLVTTPVNDYKLLPGNNFNDFSIAQTLSWLPYKFPTPAATQEEILTFVYYNGQSTATSTFAFLYFNGTWRQAYLLTPAQYIAVGHPAFSQFTSADDANIPSYLNAILKADISVMATAKVGSTQYVSFNYYTSAKVTTQRVMALTYDGTNWVRLSATTTTLAFLKTGGTWVADNTVYYTMVQADYTTISNSTLGSVAGRANIAQYPDFNTSAATDATYWSDADIQAGIILVLKAKYGSTAAVNQKFVITYAVYNFGAVTNRTKSYQYDGTNFVFVQ